MKEYANYFYAILSFIEKWDKLTDMDKIKNLENHLNIDKNHEFYRKYFDNFYFFKRKYIK